MPNETLAPPSALSLVLSNRYAIGFAYFALVSILVIFVYALATGSEVAVSEKEWLSIRPASVKEREQMAKQIDDFKKNYVRKSDYDALQSRVKDLERTTVSITQLPEELKSDDPKKVLSGIKGFFDQFRDMEGDVHFSLSVVSRHITNNGAINTGLSANDERQRNLHRHIQRCLAAINYLDKNVTGDPVETYRTILRFQRFYALSADGIIGRKTWGKIQEVYAQVQDH